MSEITVRQETEADYKTVGNIVEEAFRDEEQSNHTEHLLVARLRHSVAFVPQLSLLAECNGQVAGHILFTQINIVNGANCYPSLALAPVSVLPAFQHKGIGSKLILEGHKIATSLGFKSIVVLGHKDYYPQFGYKLTSLYNIKLPFDVPAEYCMVIELVPNGLSGVSGTVEYAKEFEE